MQIKDHAEIPTDESAFNFFEDEAITTPIETLPLMNEKITDKITSEWHNMQKRLEDTKIPRLTCGVPVQPSLTCKNFIIRVKKLL